MPPFHGEEQRLVVVVDHQRLRAEAAGLGEGSGGVGAGGLLRGVVGSCPGAARLDLRVVGGTVGSVALTYREDARQDGADEEDRGGGEEDPQAPVLAGLPADSLRFARPLRLVPGSHWNRGTPAPRG